MQMRSLGLVVALLLTCAACAPTVRSAAREASSAAVEESADELAEEETQRSMAEALEDPKMQEAAQDLTAELAEGVLEALESAQTRERMAALTELTTATAVRQMVTTLGSQRTRAELANVAGSVADSALSQISENLKHDLGPALQEILREDVSQGLAAALREEEMKGALGDTTQRVAYHAVLGANAGVDEVWRGSGGALADVRGLAGASRRWLWLLAATLGLFALVLICAAVIAVARTRRARAEVARLESATLLLATAMREKHQTEETDNILAIVQQSLEKSAEQHRHGGLFGALRLRRH